MLTDDIHRGQLRLPGITCDLSASHGSDRLLLRRALLRLRGRLRRAESGIHRLVRSGKLLLNALGVLRDTFGALQKSDLSLERRHFGGEVRVFLLAIHGPRDGGLLVGRHGVLGILLLIRYLPQLSVARHLIPVNPIILVTPVNYSL